MAKKIQLTIPEPCHENWDNMTLVDKGRFCGSCQKQVVDFSNMSDREVAQFFKKPTTGSVCGRFMQEQLDRDMEIPKKRIPWIKYFFQIALPAFLFSMKAKSQGSVKVIKSDKLSEPKAVEKTYFASETLGLIATSVKKELVSIQGEVVNEKGEPIVSATVQIKNSSTATVTDKEGNFIMKMKAAKEKITIIISSIGYDTKELELASARYDSGLRIVLSESETMLMGDVIITKCFPSRKAKPTPLIPETKDTTTNTFKVYPNPVSSGSNITLEWKETEEGYYIAQLVNQSGQTVFTKEIWIDAEARVLNLDLPTVTAGNYFIRVINKKSGKNSTEKIIIQ